jgi:hypothetical protein
MTISETLKKNWIYIVFIIIVILPLMYVGAIIIVSINEPNYRLEVKKLNENETPNFLIICCDEKGDMVQKTFLIPLTEEDFTQFPELASIIRDENVKSSYADYEGRLYYYVSLSDEEKYAIESHYPGGYLEYKGNRYHISFMHVD